MLDLEKDYQLLAEQVLQAPRGEAMDRLVAGLYLRLLGLARRELVAKPDLSRIGQAEDLVQDFLTNKVLPERKLRVLLQPIAEGRQPLWPRLSRSLVDYLYSLLRKPRPPVCADLAYREAAPQNEPESHREPRILLRRRLLEQLGAIRNAFPGQSGRAPHGPALLLQERLHLAAAVAHSGWVEEGQTVEGLSLPELVELLTPWTSPEEGASLAPGGEATLGAAWEQAKARTQGSPQDADANLVAAILGITRGRWHQWTSRARCRVIEQLGEQAGRNLFPHWFEEQKPQTGSTAAKGGASE